MRSYLKAVVIAAGSLMALPVHAEEEIVVTATRRPAAAERLPARIDVIDREYVEANGLSTLPEAIGPQAVQAGGVGQQTSVFLRGASSSHVLALIDGVRLNDASNPSGQYDFGQDTLGAFDRVEILRGPASAVYGSDAIGGVVNLIPRRGGATIFEPFLQTAVGSRDTFQVVLGAAGSAGAFEYGVSGDTFRTEGHDIIPARMATHTGDRDGAFMASATASARASAGAFALDLLVRGRASEAAYDTFSGGAFFDLRADDPDLEVNADQSIWRLGVESDASPMLAFRFAGGQVRSDREETDGGVTTHVGQSTRDFADATAKLDLRRGDATLGVSYERNAIATSSQFANSLSAEETQRAAYIISQYDLTTSIVATASARVDEFAVFGARSTYAAGLVFIQAPLRLYVTTGMGFRAPSLSERFEVSLFNVGNPELRPERSRSWEAGLDWNAAKGLRLSGTYYRTRTNDLIEYDFPQLRNINIGRARIEGAELRAEATMSDWLILHLAYDWTDARNGAGDRLSRRPGRAWSVSATIAPTERSSVVLSWRSVGERTDVTYDDTGAFESSAGEVNGFAIGALAATYDLDAHAQVFVRIDNITDEVYEQPAAFAGAPRTSMVGIRARL